MSDVKTWDDIDTSPLLRLPPEQRKALHADNDDRFRTLWADCFMVMLASYTKQEEELNGELFTNVFMAAFDKWEPKPGQTFSVYLRSAMKHESAREKQEQENTTGFKRETNRKVKKALDYMSNYGLTEAMLFRDPDAAKAVAKAVGIGAKTLLEALQNKQLLLSLDDAGDSDTALGDRTADDSESVEELAERSDELLPWLHQSLGLMSLKKKEEYGKNAGPLWSSVLMGFLRNKDAVSPKKDALDRLANCDELRPLEQDNCLWDVLLLHSYVAFTLCPPYAPKELEHAALNELKDADHNPAQDKTVAEYLDVSKAAVSQRRKTWQKKLLQMKKEQEEI